MTPSTGDPLRVLQLTAPAPFGGLETVVENLAAGLVEHGVHSTVVAVVGPGEADHPFVRKLQKRGIDIVPVTIGPRNYPAEFHAVSRLVRETRSDLIHSHGHRSDLMARLVGWRCRTPTISTLHGFIGRGRTGHLREGIQLRALRGFRAVVGVSGPIVARAHEAGIQPSRIHLVPNGWASPTAPLSRTEARTRLGLPLDEFIVGWVGRLSHEKGADVLLRAADIVRSGAIWLVIGDGPERGSLERSARSFGLEAVVRWHGARPDAPQLMPAFDVLALSSRTEGTPMVLFEAMAAGIPIVASAVGGVPAVVDAETAILVSPERPAELADAIRRVRAHPMEARGRAERALVRLREHFAVEVWAGRYAAIYQDLVGPRTIP